MNLKIFYIQENIKPSSYSLGDIIKGESLCLQYDGREWSVFYSERRLESNKRVFKDENSACEYFLEKIRDDKTIKIGYRSEWRIDQSIEEVREILSLKETK